MFTALRTCGRFGSGPFSILSLCYIASLWTVIRFKMGVELRIFCIACTRLSGCVIGLPHLFFSLITVDVVFFAIASVRLLFDGLKCYETVLR